MAVSFVNSGTEGSGTGSTVTPGAPANPAIGDIWVCVAHASIRSAITMGTGWTEAFQQNGGGTTSRLAVFWHRYNGVAPSRVVTRAGNTGSAFIAGIASYRGARRFGSPVHVVGNVTGGTDLSIEHAAITTTMDGCMILAANGSADDNGRNAVTGWTPAFEDTTSNTQRCYVIASGTPNGSVYLAHQLQAAAGQATFGVNSVADPWTSVLLALSPSMGQITSVFARNLAAGENVQDVTLAAGTAKVGIVFGRAGLADSELSADVALSCSDDAGQSWRAMNSFVIAGGARSATHRGGDAHTRDAVVFTVPWVGVERLLRVSVHNNLDADFAVDIVELV